MLLTERVSITVTDSKGKKYNRIADIVTDGCTDNVQHEVSKLINKEWAEFCKAHGEISYTWNYKQGENMKRIIKDMLPLLFELNIYSGFIVLILTTAICGAVTLLQSM